MHLAGTGDPTNQLKDCVQYEYSSSTERWEVSYKVITQRTRRVSVRWQTIVTHLYTVEIFALSRTESDSAWFAHRQDWLCQSGPSFMLSNCGVPLMQVPISRLPSHENSYEQAKYALKTALSPPFAVYAPLPVVVESTTVDMNTTSVSSQSSISESFSV